MKHTDRSYGIPLGLLAGAAVGVIGSLPIGLCSGMGMLLGLTAGAILDAAKQTKESGETESRE